MYITWLDYSAHGGCKYVNYINDIKNILQLFTANPAPKTEALANE